MACNWELLNMADYDDFDAVKRMVVLYNLLGKKAVAGDTVAAAIWIDIKSAIYDEPRLRGKLLEVVELVSQHYMPQEEIARELEVSQQTVSWRFNRAVNIIAKKLVSGELHKKRRGYSSMVAGAPRGVSSDLHIVSTIRCAMCRNEFNRSNMVNHISMYDGSDVYRCKKCFSLWQNRNSNKYRNKSPVIKNGDYCPKCHVMLTHDRRCPMNCL